MKSRVLTMTFAALLAAASATADENKRVEPTFTPIQHGTFVIQSGDVTIYIDPVGDVAAFEELPAPDIILVTDVHGDHMAPDVINALRTKETVFIAPQAVADKTDGAHALDNGESKTVDDIKIEAIPMYNLTEDRLKFHAKGRGNGYLITAGGVRIYVSGDTEDIPEMRALEDIDYAFVCMNLPYTMTVEQAASAVLEFKPVVVYPYHYRGTDGLSDVDKFRELVSKDESIEVRQLDWY